MAREGAFIAKFTLTLAILLRNALTYYFLLLETKNLKYANSADFSFTWQTSCLATFWILASHPPHEACEIYFSQTRKALAYG